MLNHFHQLNETVNVVMTFYHRTEINNSSEISSINQHIERGWTKRLTKIRIIVTIICQQSND